MDPFSTAYFDQGQQFRKRKREDTNVSNGPRLTKKQKREADNAAYEQITQTALNRMSRQERKVNKRSKRAEASLIKLERESTVTKALVAVAFGLSGVAFVWYAGPAIGAYFIGSTAAPAVVATTVPLVTAASMVKRTLIG